MKLILLAMLLLLSGCTTMLLPLYPTDKQQLEIQNKRFVKVAIVSEEYKEVMLTATKGAFKKMEKE